MAVMFKMGSLPEVGSFFLFQSIKITQQLTLLTETIISVYQCHVQQAGKSAYMKHWMTLSLLPRSANC